MILCQVLLYIQADEVKNRKKQRKVETEVLPQDTVGKQQYKLNKKDNTILTETKKLIFPFPLEASVYLFTGRIEFSTGPDSICIKLESI